MEKQIEEMAKTLCSDYGDCKRCIVENPESETICTVREHCRVLYNAGYRRKMDTAKEIFEEFESRLLNYIADYNGCYHETFDELKKKYLKGADNGKADRGN